MRYKLRAHHLLCLQFYISNGYSDEFISNMDYLFYNLKDEDEIELISSNDLICSKCPNLINGKCISIDKVNRYDNYVYSFIMNNNKDNVIKYKELKKQIFDHIISSNKLSDICSDCQWHNLCQEVKKRKYESGEMK